MKRGVLQSVTQPIYVSKEQKFLRTTTHPGASAKRTACGTNQSPGVLDEHHITFWGEIHAAQIEGQLLLKEVRAKSQNEPFLGRY